MTRQGQSCTAGSRLFLHRSIFESFLAKLEEKLAALKIGDPLDETTDMGAIISRKQFDRVCSYIDDGRRQPGARLVLGGLPPGGTAAQGYFIQPTVFADVRNEWRIAREEIFGPVMVAIPWEDEADAVRMANDSHYGLAAYIWTGISARRFAPRTPSNPDGSRSIRDSVSFPDSPTAATSRAASAARSRSRGCSTATPSERTSPSTSSYEDNARIIAPWRPDLTQSHRILTSR